jgi:hypothetical protein
VANFVWRGVLVFRRLVWKPALLLQSGHAFWGLPSGGSQIATVAKTQQMSTGFVATHRRASRFPYRSP